MATRSAAQHRPGLQRPLTDGLPFEEQPPPGKWRGFRCKRGGRDAPNHAINRSRSPSCRLLTRWPWPRVPGEAEIPVRHVSRNAGSKGERSRLDMTWIEPHHPVAFPGAPPDCRLAGGERYNTVVDARCHSIIRHQHMTVDFRQNAALRRTCDSPLISDRCQDHPIPTRSCREACWCSRRRRG